MSRGEKGSATLFAVACLGVLLVVTTAFAAAVALFVAHRQAQSAADLAALAGAVALGRGEDGCGAAARVAVENAARLQRCTVTGLEIVVDVEVAGPDWWGRAATLAGRARAGPA